MGRAGARTVPRGLVRAVGPLALLALWWLATATGWIGPETLPSPESVLDTAGVLLREGVLLPAVWTSLRRVLIGTAIGVGLGTAIAVVAGWSRRGEDLVDPTMQVVKAVPKYALVPMLIIWLGIGEEPKIVLIMLATAVPVYVNVYSGIRNLDQRLVDAARSLGLGRAGQIRHVLLPGSTPGFLAGLRISLTSAWLALIVAEQINAQSGLGLLMTEARANLRTDEVVLVIVLYALLGLLSYGFVRLLERRLLAWRQGYAGT